MMLEELANTAAGFCNGVPAMSESLTTEIEEIYVRLKIFFTSK